MITHDDGTTQHVYGEVARAITAMLEADARGELHVLMPAFLDGKPVICAHLLTDHPPRDAQ